MPITAEAISMRGVVWEKANEMVGPLIEEHGVEKVTFGGGFFPTSDVITPVNQHIDAIIRVANWLLKEDD